MEMLKPGGIRSSSKGTVRQFSDRIWTVEAAKPLQICLPMFITQAWVQLFVGQDPPKIGQSADLPVAHSGRKLLEASTAQNIAFLVPSTEPISPEPTPADCPWPGAACIPSCEPARAVRQDPDWTRKLRFGGRRSHGLSAPSRPCRAIPAIPATDFDRCIVWSDPA